MHGPVNNHSTVFCWGERERGGDSPLGEFQSACGEAAAPEKGACRSVSPWGETGTKESHARPAWGERERGGDSPLGEFQSACGEATVPEKKDLPSGKSSFSGASGRIRTGDLLITNQLRYQLRYRSKASVFQSRGVL